MPEGEQGEGQDGPPPEKAYCCGNSTQREASLISKFDLILSLVLFSIIFTFLLIVGSNPDYFTDIAKNTPGNGTTDLSAFLQWPRSSQLSVLSLSVVLHLLYIILAILLWIGARKRHHKLLLIWFISTLVTYTAGFILTIVSICFLHDVVALSVGLITIFLYKWYSLWIVKILMREITSVSEAEGYNGGIELPESEDVLDSAMSLQKF